MEIETHEMNHQDMKTSFLVYFFSQKELQYHCQSQWKQTCCGCKMTDKNCYFLELRFVFDSCEIMCLHSKLY